MKKILFVTNIESPYRVRFFDELSSQYDVTVVFTDRNEEDKERESAWFPQGENRFQNIHLSKRLRLPRMAPVGLDIVKWLKKPFDAIILGGYASPTLMLAIGCLRLRRIPFYMEVDGGLIRQDPPISGWLKGWLIGSADQWLSSGKATTDFLVHYGAKPEKVHCYPFSSLEESDILPEPVSPEMKAALRRELGITEKYAVLAIGQFVPRKGFDVLLRSAPNLMPGTGIYIIGGQAPEEYRQLARNCGDTAVHFVGFQNKQTLAKYYQAADVFALPTREDIWGLVVNEALGYGLPVVTTDRCVAGLELVENGLNGWIVPVEDEQALAEKINAVLAADGEKMSRAALEKIRPYTIEGMVRAHREILG